MTPCFWTNPWYTDHVTPSAYAAGVATWSTPTYAGGEAGSALNWPGRIFSTVEFGCGGVDVVYSMVLWFYFIVATDKTSFSMVKALYK